MLNNTILRNIGYVGFGIASLLIGLYLTFPAEAVGQRLAHEMQQRSRGKLSLSFEDISLYRLSGISAETVKVRTTKEGEQPIEVTLDAVRARLRLLPLLWLSPSLD